MTARTIIAALFVLLLASNAHAEISGCFERIYDKAHLKANSKQFVRGIQVQINLPQQDTNDEEDGDEDLITILTTKSKQQYFVGPFCKSGKGLMTCTTSETGEAFTITKTQRGIKLTLKSDIRAIEGGGDSTRFVTLKKGQDNGVFALVRISSGTCDAVAFQ